MEKALAVPVHVSIDRLAQMLLFDCRLGIDNQQALDRIAQRIQRHIDTLAPVQPEQEPARTYLDQIDADSEATQWLHAMLPDGKERVFWSLETFNFSPQEGRVRLLREREKLIACTVIVRDGLNRSQLLKWLIATPPAAQ
jgi:hypothetical protein